MSESYRSNTIRAADRLRAAMQEEARLLVAMGDTRGYSLMHLADNLSLASLERIARDV